MPENALFPSSLLPALAAAGLAAPFTVLAQRLPDAGSLLQEVRPPPITVPRADPPVLPQAPALRPAMPAGGPKLAPRHFHITGATLFTQAQLLPLVQDGVGREMDLAGLEDLAARISRFYRAHGYTVAHAYIPQQDVTDGTVEIAVIEGRYGAITIQGPAAGAAPRSLGGVNVGDVVADAPLERALLLLADRPGIATRATLQPGASVGTSELVVDVQPGERFTGRVDADNYGSRASGSERLGASLAVNNATGLADVAGLNLLTTGEGMQYGRAAWQLPVGNRGTKAGIAYSDMRYKLLHEFEVLQANGSAGIASAFVAHPLLRSRGANLNAQVALDDKRIEDRMDAVAVATSKTARVLNFGLSGDAIDDFGGGGSTAASATYSQGRLEIRSPTAAAADAATARTQGHYDKFSLSVLRLQSLGGATSLYASFIGQWAGKNLDSSEKLPLGGPTAVRAYPQGEASADDAQILTLELRQSVSAAWQFVGFVDAGRATINQSLWAGATGVNRRHLSGAGIGVNWADPSGWTARAAYAHRLGNEPATSEPDSSSRFWLQVTRNF
ncbi:ShlB/FhaC/HecB family hemolysin secretion/activation protein [Ramlibacter sp. G-1-2-2]|uniref:ShlB/FhaC/HecB family hemolysin secretion/activation protein n=1 Tax=Ramlibacter agri TaxID=2728837 RepID=A0A848HGM4_9BURK|nr:ShlB/FhaC/HecB family hemolysin secretion/activation protein [Ramlibacter agri]NML48471.1 ShlB/FhaC/HecB family hemolysin secretion/activation protein [Ramlibacter agri]